MKKELRYKGQIVSYYNSITKKDCPIKDLYINLDLLGGKRIELKGIKAKRFLAKIK